jgi:hypothetical protein
MKNNQRRNTYPNVEHDCNCIHDIINLYEIITKLEKGIKELEEKIKLLEKK